MINGKKIVVVMPAYNAEMTVLRTIAEVDRAVVDHIILVDDASSDATARIAREAGIEVHIHQFNLGYGGNQKTCYRLALQSGADIIIMLHPDYQYTPQLVTAMASMIAYGTYDMVLGSRILGRGALVGGMPLYKYVANRLLTATENVLLGLKLSEYHTGYRAFSRTVVESLPLDRNSDDFVFDNQMIVQAHAAGFLIGEVSCPTYYHPEASSINFRRSVVYGLGVLRTATQYRAHSWGLVHVDFLEGLADYPSPPQGSQTMYRSR